MFSSLKKFWKRFLVIAPVKCKHLNKKEVFRYYPDAYIEFKCLDCGAEVFKDMYTN